MSWINDRIAKDYATNAANLSGKSDTKPAGETTTFSTATSDCILCGEPAVKRPNYVCEDCRKAFLAWRKIYKYNTDIKGAEW